MTIQFCARHIGDGWICRIDDITATGRPYSDFVLLTTKHERVLDLPTLSYKNATGRPYSDLVLLTTKHERVLGLPTFSYKNASHSTFMELNEETRKWGAFKLLFLFSD